MEINCKILLLYFLAFGLMNSISTEGSTNFDCFSTRKVAVNRTTRNFGFHRSILTKLEWLTNQKGILVDNEAHCKFLLKEHLPKGLYVDLDQIKESEEFTGIKVFSKVRIDTEAPAHLSMDHEIFVFVQADVNDSTEDQETVSASIELPVHLRYHKPKINEMSTTFSLSQPTVLALCTKDGINALEQGCRHLFVEAPCGSGDWSSEVCQWLPLQVIPEVGIDKKELQQTFSVPVGCKEHKSIVIIATTLCTVFGAIYIVWPNQV